MQEVLINIVNENFVLPLGKSKIDEHTKLFKTGIIDSFALLDLLLIIEDELNISLELSEIIGENIETIIDLANYIKTLKSK